MNIQHSDGLIAAMFTPFHKDGSINLNLFPPLIEHLVRTGHRGIFACGTNGEGPSLTIEERMSAVEAIVRESRGKLKTIVHVGHASIGEAQKLARHAFETGADAISSVAAFYFKPTSTANLVDCMAQIASAAPEMPFYYYHIPPLINIRIDILEFMRLAEQRIPNFAGVKFTDTALWEFQSCINYQNGKYDILYGFDENHLAALSVGMKGAIGSTYCFAAPFYLEIRKLFANGELNKARELMQKTVDIVLKVVSYPPIPAQRAVMKMLGMDLGPCRLPLTPLSPREEAALKAELENLKFFELLDQFSNGN